MKPILYYLTGQWPSWSETFIRREVDALWTANLNLEIVSLYGQTTEDTPYPISILKKNFIPSSSLTIIKRWYQPLLSQFPSWRKFFTFFSHYPLYRALHNIYCKNPPVHIHVAFAGLPLLLVAFLKRKYPHLVFSLSVHARDVYACPWDQKEEFFLSDRIFCCNAKLYQTLQDHYPELRNRIVLNYHGIPLEEWPFRSPLPLQQPLQFLFVGRLVSKKAPDVALLWVERLKSCGIQCHLTVVGEGPLKSQIPSVGICTSKEVKTYMEKSHFLLVPSRELPDGDQEGIPNVILEAMAIGLPIITIPTGGIPEVVTEKTGFLISEGAEEFVQLIQRLMVDPISPELVNKVHNARQLVEKHFNLQQNIQSKLAYLKEKMVIS